MKHMYNLSIIIPHKNIPLLLNRCLESMPQRDDIQIIIVDDNSDIEKVDFINFPGINRKNTEVIFSKKGGGAGFARNVGLNQAKGEWVLFADSDDFFTKDAFLTIEKYFESNYDLIYFKMVSCYSDTLEDADRHSQYSNKIDSYLQKQDQISEDILRYWMPGPIAKIIKRKLILDNKIRFDEVAASNDIMFSAKVGYFAKKIHAVSIPIYVATIRKGSLTKIRNKDILYCRYIVSLRFSVFMKEIGKHYLQSYVTSRVVDSLFYYGPIEFFKYIKAACKYKVNIFFGIKDIKSSTKRWLMKKIKADKYIVK